LDSPDITVGLVALVINWVMKNKLLFSSQKSTAVFIYGESSGANLAIAALLAREKNDVQGMVLMCPSLDYHNQYKSKIQYSKGFLLDEDVRMWFASQYLNNLEEKKNSLVSPALSKNLHLLPQTLIIYSYFDPLRDETEVFHNKLIKNGVRSKLRQFDTIHGFFNFRIQPYSKIADGMINNFINHAV
jgi:acetyl esterase